MMRLVGNRSRMWAQNKTSIENICCLVIKVNKVIASATSRAERIGTNTPKRRVRTSARLQFRF